MDNLNQERQNQGVEPGGRFDLGLKTLVNWVKFLFFGMVLVIMGMLVYYVTISGLCRVGPQESAIVLRFGKYVATMTEGWRWYLPSPVNSFVYIKTSPQIINIDFNAQADMQMQNPEMGDAGGPLVPGTDRYLLTGDANIIHSSWAIEYRVSNPRKYYETVLGPVNPLDPDAMQFDPKTKEQQGTRGPQTMLSNLFSGVVLKVSAGKEIRELLYDNKAFSDEVQAQFVKLVTQMDLGMEISNVILKQAVPPKSTRKAFSEVTEANQVRSSEIEKAREYCISVENDTQVKAQMIRSEAQTYHTRIVAQVKSESIYFTNIYEQYKNSPDTVLMALYNSTLSSVLNSVNEKYIVGSDSTGEKRRQVRLKLNPEPKRTKKADNSEAGGR